MKNRERIITYEHSDIVTDEHGYEVSPYDDDYNAYCDELDDMTNPLSDDYSKYDNE